MKLIITTSLILLLLTACGDSTYTLYRSSAVEGGDSWRMHVATFDANEKGDYNMQNCQIAQGLFQKQPNVRVRYWCEKGTFKK